MFLKRLCIVLLIVNAALLLFALLVYVVGLIYGDGNAFYLSPFSHMEWTLVSGFIVGGIELAQRSSWLKTRRLVWPVSLAVIISSAVAGILLDLFYQFVGPVFNISFDLSIVYFDILLPPYVTNTLTYTFWGLVIAVPVSVHFNMKMKLELIRRLKNMERERMEDKLQIAQLESLKAKIKPHFLYNALNSVVSQVHSNPDTASQMVINLSEFFRESISRPYDNFSSVADELELIQLYLKIEKIRFKDSLEVKLDVEQDCLDRKIPTFILQPLVENAVLHGASKVENGKLEIRINRTDEGLRIIVGDNGPHFPESINYGKGLSGVLDRLKLTLGTRFTFNLFNSPSKGIEIILYDLE